MCNVMCHLCGGLVDRIGLQPPDVRLCKCVARPVVPKHLGPAIARLIERHNGHLRNTPPTDTPPGGEREEPVTWEEVSPLMVDAFQRAPGCGRETLDDDAEHEPDCSHCIAIGLRAALRAVPAVPSEAMVEAGVAAVHECEDDLELDERVIVRAILTAALRSGAPQEGVDRG